MKDDFLIFFHLVIVFSIQYLAIKCSLYLEEENVKNYTDGDKSSVRTYP